MMKREIIMNIGKVVVGLIMVFVGTLNFFIELSSKNIILILLIFGGGGTIMWGLTNTKWKKRNAPYVTAQEHTKIRNILFVINVVILIKRKNNT